MVDINLVKSFCAGRYALLIEDNEINAMITEKQLKSVGFEVEWATDGAQGLSNYLASENGHFSIVVTDLMMPVMNGHEMAKQIRKSGRKDAKLPIVALTANAYVNQADFGRDSDINKFFTKPYDKDKLLEWIYENIRKYEEINARDN